MHDCQMELFLQPVETAGNTGMSLVMPHMYGIYPYLYCHFKDNLSRFAAEALLTFS